MHLYTVIGCFRSHSDFQSLQQQLENSKKRFIKLIPIRADGKNIGNEIIRVVPHVISYDFIKFMKIQCRTVATYHKPLPWLKLMVWILDNLSQIVQINYPKSIPFT